VEDSLNRIGILTWSRSLANEHKEINKQLKEFTITVDKEIADLKKRIEEFYHGAQFEDDWQTIRDKVVLKLQHEIDMSADRKKCFNRLDNMTKTAFREVYKSYGRDLAAQLDKGPFSAWKQQLQVKIDESVRSTSPPSGPGSPGAQGDDIDPAAFGLTTSLATGAVLGGWSLLVGNLGGYQVATTLLSYLGTFSFSTYTGLTSGIAAIGGPLVAGTIAALGTGLVAAILVAIWNWLFWRDKLMRAVEQHFNKPEVVSDLQEVHREFIEQHRRAALDFTSVLRQKMLDKAAEQAKKRRRVASKAAGGFLVRVLAEYYRDPSNFCLILALSVLTTSIIVTLAILFATGS